MNLYFIGSEKYVSNRFKKKKKKRKKKENVYYHHNKSIHLS